VIHSKIHRDHRLIF